MKSLTDTIKGALGGFSHLTTPTVKIGDFEYGAGRLQELFEHPGMTLTNFNVDDLNVFVNESDDLLSQYKDTSAHYSAIAADVTYARDLIEHYNLSQEIEGIEYEHSL